MPVVRSCCLVLLGLGIALFGCRGPGRDVSWLTDANLEYYRDRGTLLAQPISESPREQPESWRRPPRTVTEPTEDSVRDLGLAEALRLALENNSVIRTRAGFLSRGNALLSSPDRVASTWDPAIQETGVLFGGRGVTAALSAFDPEFTTTMIWGRNETAQNNAFFGGGIGSGSTLVAETGNFTSEIRKQFGYGASVSVGHNWNYLGSNAPAQQFNSNYVGDVRLRYRQPLMAGAGTEFTRIAGPVTQQFRGLSGVSQGVIIARINNDLTLNQFEANAINLVKDIEDLYWELYLAYRKWDTSVTARNSAQKSWRDTKLILEAGGRPGITPADEAQARDQFFQTRAAAQLALSTLYRTETALRRILGLTVNDGTVLRPSDEPVTAQLVPDWSGSLVEALTQRVELRRQLWSIKSLELQLGAASSLTRPRLDFVSGYQVNAMGDDLIASTDGVSGFRSGYGSLVQGDQTGWNLGVELTLPLGMRSAHAQVRNLELRLAKAREVLNVQEMEISHELADAFQGLSAHYTAMQSNFNRQDAARQRVELFEVEVKAGTKTLDQLLRAQASLADAEVAYFTSLVAYNQALTNLHFRSGSLLTVNSVQLSESDWTPAAYRDALRRAWERSHGFDNSKSLRAEPEPFTEPPPTSVPSQSPPDDVTGHEAVDVAEPAEEENDGRVSGLPFIPPFDADRSETAGSPSTKADPVEFLEPIRVPTPRR